MARKKPKKRPPPGDTTPPQPAAPPSPSPSPPGGPAERPGEPPLSDAERPGEPPLSDEAKQVELTKSKPEEPGFTPEVLDRTIIAIPLLRILKAEKPPAPGSEPETHPVIIDLNLLYPVDGRRGARKRVKDELIPQAIQLAKDDRKRKSVEEPTSEGVNESKSALSEQYLFCRLTAESIRQLVRLDSYTDPDLTSAPKTHRNAIYHIWPDFRLKPLITRTVSTVKADAAHRSFSALGEGIVWAVIDSGIDGNHPHFKDHKNLEFAAELSPKDFTEVGTGVKGFGLTVLPPGSAASAIPATGKSLVVVADVQGVAGKSLLHFRIFEPDGRQAVATDEEQSPDRRPQIAELRNQIQKLGAVGTPPEEVKAKVIESVVSVVGYTSAHRDVFGHGTHVAGIIAGETAASAVKPVLVTTRRRDENDVIQREQMKITTPFSGMAPRCTLLSLKVLDDQGDGEVSSIIAAIEHIQEINGQGRRIRVQGVNLSVGYDFEPEWFACGQSPLCVEVNRLVRSGVVVVVAAGNSGYGAIMPEFRGKVNAAGLGMTINDPGNADFAITVGSTHRDMPHVYGVSYFSSKGPTGDGRYKPDLVAPGEKIISCRSDHEKPPTTEQYKEESGTSMAAPHVSGVIAAFLSIRREFIGQPEEVKKIFLSTATDLNRAPYLQGKGLVDLMRAIQSV
jgi:subtilisin family serine protease